jgi:hypothetical protein
MVQKLRVAFFKKIAPKAVKFAALSKHKRKTFLSTSNVIISQPVWSSFLKLFAHVLLVVKGKILRLKVPKMLFFFLFFSSGLLELEMAVLGCFLREKTLGL